MKRVLFAFVALLIFGVANSQQVYRTEFSTFDLREASIQNDHSKTEHYLQFAPKSLEVVDNVEVTAQVVDIPIAWSDFNVYIHLQNLHQAYHLVVNEQLVASVEDSITPSEFLLSPYLRQGRNEILVLLYKSKLAELESGSAQSSAPRFEGSYIFAQYRKHVFDYVASITPSEDGKKLMFEMDIIARNDFNVEEPLQIGYDIYSPDNRVVDYGVRELTIAGRSTDTLRMQVSLGDESRFLWSSANPKLYRVMLYVKRDGKPREYTTFYLGAGSTTFTDGKILRNNTPIEIKSAKFNANGTYNEVASQIKELQEQGINTLMPDNPQPKWFYNICDKLGMYVIECSNINPVWQPQNRMIGGTPSNNPKLAKEYISRVKAMYYRTRNHPCVIAYALGGDKAGNGYNMYKAYQWLKSVEKSRAVICNSADGEWNTDL